jgi:hypothetical protein
MQPMESYKILRVLQMTIQVGFRNLSFDEPLKIRIINGASFSGSSQGTSKRRQTSKVLKDVMTYKGFCLTFGK